MENIRYSSGDKVWVKFTYFPPFTAEKTEKWFKGIVSENIDNSVTIKISDSLHESKVTLGYPNSQCLFPRFEEGDRVEYFIDYDVLSDDEEHNGCWYSGTIKKVIDRLNYVIKDDNPELFDIHYRLVEGDDRCYINRIKTCAMCGCVLGNVGYCEHEIEGKFYCDECFDRRNIFKEAAKYWKYTFKPPMTPQPLFFYRETSLLRYDTINVNNASHNVLKEGELMETNTTNPFKVGDLVALKEGGELLPTGNGQYLDNEEKN